MQKKIIRIIELIEILKKHSFVTGCTINEFLCDNNRCIPKNLLCDFNPDCNDETDEMNCGELINDIIEMNFRLPRKSELSPKTIKALEWLHSVVVSGVNPLFFEEL